MAIQQEILLACCDGSYDPHSRTAAYGMVLGTAAGLILCASGLCTRCASQLSPTRFELCDINTMVCLLYCLCPTCGISGGSITPYNDCLKAHKQVNASSRKFKCFLEVDYNVINKIRGLIKRLRNHMSFSLVWVKGHYSGQKREIQHDMNDEVLQLATSALAATRHQFSDIAPPSSLITLRSCDSLTSKWQATLQEQAHADSLHQTIYKNSKWSEDQFHMVDWTALKSFLHRLSRVRQISYRKLLHGLLNTNERNKKFYIAGSS